MKFAKVLRELRTEKGLTQVQLAMKFNVTEGTVRGWESRNHQLSYEVLCDLAKIFNVTVGQLLGVED